MEIRELDLSGLVEDQWWAVVNTVTNIRANNLPRISWLAQLLLAWKEGFWSSELVS